jgi:LPS-assembly protein
MRSLLLLVLLLGSFLYGADNKDKVEVYATTINTKDNVVTASDDVVVVYKDYQLSAKRAIYNRNTGVLELFDNVRANQGDTAQFLGEYAKLNIAEKERTFKPFFMLEKKSNVWISGCESYAKDIEVEVKSGVVSGCDPNDPIWTMEFTSGEYNTDTMWLDLYNARIYIYDIPVFYTPYFGYSLDTTRRTGLLPPKVGWSADEGFFYQQSLFIAESNWWDLEITPQTRTQRGSGAYSTFRWVDSAHSAGSITGGYFKEKSKYFNATDSDGERENDLANQKHYGYNIHYENTDFLNQFFGTNFKGQSGMYLDFNYMNDVEYINLASSNVLDTATATQVISRANMFYNTDDNYVGMYMKYYKDLEKDSNAETLQNLPAIQYHSYLGTLLEDHFLYNLDIKANNFHRDEGQGAVQTDLNIPLQLQTSLFDEYMNVSYTSYLYAQQTSFNGEDKLNPPTEVDDGLYARNYHVFNASSQLTRAYDDMTHVVDFGSQYIVAGDDYKDGFYDDEKGYCLDKKNRSNSDYNSKCEFYNVSDIEENLQLYFSQYIYGNDGKQIIYHRLAQSFNYDAPGSEVGEIENELDYQVTEHISYYNNMFYNHQKAAFSKNYNKVSYNDKKFNFGLGYMYQENFYKEPNDVGKYTRFMTSSITYKYNKHYSYNLTTDYDFEIRKKKTLAVGFLYQKKCWDFGISYVENNRPTLDSDGNPSSQKDRFIFFTIALKPAMQAGDEMGQFVYRLPQQEGS